MQPQEILTALIIVLPTAFALLMLADFVAGLRNLIPPTPIVEETIPKPPEPMALFPARQPEPSLSKVQPAPLPDPWDAPMNWCVPTPSSAVAATTTLFLLPPAKELTPAATPKRKKGRPRKVAA